ncbi:glycosyltransferase family 2 protein [Seonamhaeicola sp. MEBiC1930]|uniref:glycosyltransferase family 2 protein n=1 Tax=Seonamhaeicola sp. MEBiC01930 TaxID=2976768 RepID=UPI003248393A
MKVSIITPTYNSERFIEDTIKSVINQTYKDWELIIIDDNSTDTTIEIVSRFSNRNSNIRLIKNKKNSGAAFSRNKGIKEAKGDFIAFLDADDLWKPEKLEKQISFMQINNCKVCYSSYELMNEEGELLNKQISALQTLSYKKLLKSNYVGNLTGIYNAKSLGKITSINLRKRQDWLIWLEAIKKSGKPAMGIKESLAIYRVRESSVSSNKWNLLKYNYWVYKKGLGFSSRKSIYCLIIFLFEHFFVKSKQKISL